jgi:predicted ArsR family transcriptional regulator
MNITLSVDEQVLERARERLRASGKSINQEIREHLQQLAGDDDVERDIEEFVRTSGTGKPESGWKWNRDEIHQERLTWPRK